MNSEIRFLAEKKIISYRRYSYIMELFCDLNRGNTLFLTTLFYIVILTTNVTALRPEEVYLDMKIVKSWSEDLSRELVRFSKGVTSLTYISDEYAKYSDVRTVSGDALVQTIAADIKDLLKEKLDAVLALAKEAERIYQNYTYDPDLDIDYLNSKQLLSTDDVGYISEHSSEYVAEMAQEATTLELKADKQFNNEPVNHDNSTVHVPTNVYDRFPKILNGAYWTQKLNDQFKENEKKDKSLRWQYFCSTDGFFRVFPGMKWPRDNVNGIDIYDCRVRAWYLHAATCPKNVLMLLDSSGSMKGSRMVIARNTVKAILNTLDDDDYFNIIRFSDTTEFVDDCFNDTMMPATTQNKRRLQEAVDQNVTASETANFRKAFDKAYHLLNSLESKKRGKLCNMAILLITDGVPEHYDSVFKYWTNNFQDITTRVFTFLIGREIDDDREVRWMACANKGYYSHISTLADVQENVQNYIKVMSRQMVIERQRNKIWTPIYLDHMSYLDKMDLNKGLQFMTSVAIPVFDLKNETYFEGNLLGVMGTDIPIELMKEQIPVHKLGANGYAFMLNHNGYVLMHPDYRPYKKIKKTKELVLHPYYENVDFTDVALPVHRNEFQQIVIGLLSGKNNFGSKAVKFMTHYKDMKRMVKRNYNIYTCKVQGTDFSIGIALPATSLSELLSVRPVPSMLDECLNGTDIELAPWFYCKDLDPTLTGRERIKELKRLVKEGRDKCNFELLGNLVHDTRRLTKLRRWWGNNIGSQGIELIFIGTSSGLTKYVSTNDSVPDFILNNTNTLDALYYRRAVEGVERVDGQPTYNFTYSISFDKEFNPNTTRVIASAPVVKTNSNRAGVPTIFAVVGFHMMYEKFEEFLNTATKPSPRCKGPSCACDGESVRCYLVDNHGYVMSKSVYPEDAVGKFFGDVENPVMEALVRDNVFEGYNFTDYQALCDIKASERERSSAVKLLNPIKTILNGIFWTITEIVMFLSEFSLKSAWTSVTSVHAAQNEQEDCDKVIAEYDYEELEPQERISYNQVKKFCSSKKALKKVLGYRPCHRSFTLYKANFNMSPAHGSVKGCQTNYSRCEVKGCTGEIIECNIFYRASWVKDTNLLLVVVSRGDCGTCEDAPLYDFGLAHTELIESDEKKCEDRKRSKYVDADFECYDFYRNETLPCGTTQTRRLSLSLLILTLILCLKSFTTH